MSILSPATRLWPKWSMSIGPVPARFLEGRRTRRASKPHGLSFAKPNENFIFKTQQPKRRRINYCPDRHGVGRFCSGRLPGIAWDSKYLDHAFAILERRHPGYRGGC